MCEAKLPIGRRIEPLTLLTLVSTQLPMVLKIASYLVISCAVIFIQTKHCNFPDKISRKSPSATLSALASEILKNGFDSLQTLKC